MLKTEKEMLGLIIDNEQYRHAGDRPPSSSRGTVADYTEPNERTEGSQYRLGAKFLRGQRDQRRDYLIQHFREIETLLSDCGIATNRFPQRGRCTSNEKKAATKRVNAQLLTERPLSHTLGDIA